MQTVMYQKWQNLLFLHWEADETELRKSIPAGLEVDKYEGKAYFGLVLFTMSGIRARYLPEIPGTSTFHEFNARTYVRKGEKSGVWFFSLDAANALAVRVARARYKLPYFHADMEHESDQTVRRYRSTRRSSNATVAATAEVSGNVWHAETGTLDHFLIERYRLFAAADSCLYSAQVQHEPYPLRSAKLLSLDESLSRAAGVSVHGAPMVHYADGVSTRIGRIVRE